MSTPQKQICGNCKHLIAMFGFWKCGADEDKRIVNPCDDCHNGEFEPKKQ